MRHVLISAAALTAFVTFLAIPAKADMHFGPTQVGNQCFKWQATNSRDATFGYWSECPKPASVVSAPRRRHHHS